MRVCVYTQGYLHIGHAKAMHIDFGQSIVHGGECYLRYDDTNPAAEKQEYIDAIQEVRHGIYIYVWVGGCMPYTDAVCMHTHICVYTHAA